MMMRFASGVLAIAVFGIMIPQATSAAQPVPAEVTAKLREMDGFCRENGGRPSGTAHIIRADLNGDGLTDYVIDETGYECPSTPNLFVGASLYGTAYVYLATGRGRARLALEQASRGVELSSRSNPPVLLLNFSPEACGGVAGAASHGCDRPLVWNADRRTISLGRPQPVSSTARGQVAAAYTDVSPAALSQLLVGIWETTEVDTENDPGRCLSTPKDQQYDIMTYEKTGKLHVSAQDGEAFGSWRILQDGKLVTITDKYEESEDVEVVNKDHLLVRNAYGNISRHRRCNWR